MHREGPHIYLRTYLVTASFQGLELFPNPIGTPLADAIRIASRLTFVFFCEHVLSSTTIENSPQTLPNMNLLDPAEAQLHIERLRNELPEGHPEFECLIANSLDV